MRPPRLAPHPKAPHPMTSARACRADVSHHIFGFQVFLLRFFAPPSYSALVRSWGSFGKLLLSYLSHSTITNNVSVRFWTLFVQSASSRAGPLLASEDVRRQSIAKDRYACPAPSPARTRAQPSGPGRVLTYLRLKKIHPREVPLPANSYTSSERPPNCTGGAGRVSSRFGKAGPGVSPGECMAPVIAPTLAPHFCAQPAQSLCLDHFHRLRRLPRWPFLESTAQ